MQECKKTYQVLVGCVATILPFLIHLLLHCYNINDASSQDDSPLEKCLNCGVEFPLPSLREHLYTCQVISFILFASGMVINAFSDGSGYWSGS